MAAPVVAVLGRGIVPADATVVGADDLGINRGDGVFDAARIVADSHGIRVDHLEEHLARFVRSHEHMGMRAPDLDAWRALINEALDAWPHAGEAILKLISTRGQEHDADAPGTGLALIFAATTPTCAPIRVITLTTGRTSDAFRDAPWLLGGVKTLSYAVNVAAAREASARGADDVLFVTTDGFCLEGPRSGLIVARDGGWFTTPVDGTGILASVTIDIARRGLSARGETLTERLLTPAEVRTADGAWLLSAGRGVSEIITLDGHPVARTPDASALLRTLTGF